MRKFTQVLPPSRTRTIARALHAWPRASIVTNDSRDSCRNRTRGNSSACFMTKVHERPHSATQRLNHHHHIIFYTLANEIGFVRNEDRSFRNDLRKYTHPRREQFFRCSKVNFEGLQSLLIKIPKDIVANNKIIHHFKVAQLHFLRAPPLQKRPVSLVVQSYL